MYNIRWNRGMIISDAISPTEIDLAKRGINFKSLAVNVLQSKLNIKLYFSIVEDLMMGPKHFPTILYCSIFKFTSHFHKLKLFSFVQNTI